MKDVYGKYLYDTGHATALASAKLKYHTYSYRGLPMTETLYRTKNGRYFIHREMEGAQGFWANLLGGGEAEATEELEPITPSEAWHWCREHKVKHSSVGMKDPEEA